MLEICLYFRRMATQDYDTGSVPEAMIESEATEVSVTNRGDGVKVTDPEISEEVLNIIKRQVAEAVKGLSPAAARAPHTLSPLPSSGDEEREHYASKGYGSEASSEEAEVREMRKPKSKKKKKRRSRRRHSSSDESYDSSSSEDSDSSHE